MRRLSGRGCSQTQLQTEALVGATSSAPHLPHKDVLGQLGALMEALEVEGKLGLCMTSTIRAAQQGPGLRSLPHRVKDGASEPSASGLEGPLLSNQSGPTSRWGD